MCPYMYISKTLIKIVVAMIATDLELLEGLRLSSGNVYS